MKSLFRPLEGQQHIDLYYITANCTFKLRGLKQLFSFLYTEWGC